MYKYVNTLRKLYIHFEGMRSMGGRAVAEKPMFSSGQIINASDVQRKWKERIVPKLDEYPFLMMLSGSEPKAAIMSYEHFEELWEKSQEAAELRLQLELLTRMFTQRSSKRDLVPLAELVAESGILPEELVGDIDVESDLE